MNKKIILILSFMLLILSFSVLGFSTLSVSKVDFKEDGDLIKPYFLLSGVAGYDSTSYTTATYRIESSDIVAQIKGTTNTATATRNVDITMTTAKYTCDYLFSAYDSNYVYSYKISDQTYWDETTLNRELTKLLAPNEEIIYYYIPKGDIKYRGIIRQKIYTQGFVTPPKENFEIEFSMSNGLQTLSTAKISSTIQANSNFYDGAVKKASITWAGGGLKTPMSCPTASATSLQAIQNIGSDSFALISASDLQTYKTNEFNLIKTFDEYSKLNVLEKTFSSAMELSNIQNKINSVNSAITSFLIKNYLIDAENKQYPLISTGKTKTIVLTKPFTLPVFTMQIDADWVGVVIPKGEPKIISFTPEIISGESGIGKELKITVKNIGTKAGTFQAFGTCQGKIATGTDYKGFNAGETQVMNINFNSINNNEITEDCKITVMDVNDNERRDTITIKAFFKPKLNLVEGMESCVGNNLMVVRNNIWVTIENCENGCIKIDAMNSECKGDNIQCTIDSQCAYLGSGYKCLSNQCVASDEKQSSVFGVSLVIALLLSVFATLFVNSYVPNIKGRKWAMAGIYVGITIILLFIVAYILKFFILSFATFGKIFGY